MLILSIVTLPIGYFTGFELQYDDKPFFDNSSVREALYDSSTRSRVVSNLVGDTVYVFRVRPILSVPRNGDTWSNMVAAETKGEIFSN